MLRSFVIAATLAGACATAQADVYRVIDAQGRAQYTDRWMPGAELVKVDRSRETPETVAARQSVEQGKLANSNASIAAQQTKANDMQAVKQEVAKAREEQCKKDKERYEKSIQARRLYKENKDGTREYQTDAEADAYRLRARESMQASCGAAGAGAK